jgi:hypothetical protein
MTPEDSRQLLRKIHDARQSIERITWHRVGHDSELHAMVSVLAETVERLLQSQIKEPTDE